MEKYRDRGNSEKRAQEIQEIVGHLGQMSALPVIERPDASQLHKTLLAGFDSEGRYLTPED